MNVVINQYGFIKNGSCDKRLKSRNIRSVGGWIAWEDCKEQGCIKYNNEKMELIKMPKKRKYAEFFSVDEEIGYLRIIQDLFPILIKKKKSFKHKELWAWIEGLSSCEFGIATETPLSIITPGEEFLTGLIPPKPQDDLYYEKIYGVKKGLVKG